MKPKHPNLTRRHFLTISTATGLLYLIPTLSYASVIREINGLIWVNNAPATLTTLIKPGDTVKTGENSKIIFVIGEDVYKLGARSTLRLRGHEESTIVSTMRLLNGTLMAVFGKGKRTIRAPTAAIGIRGTGVFLKIENEGTYFCTCYGKTATQTRHKPSYHQVDATHHKAYLITHDMNNPRIYPDRLREHQDQELFDLESLVERQPPATFK